ncbi:MAG: phospholipase D-like domain-containing protein [archaeon]
MAKRTNHKTGLIVLLVLITIIAILILLLYLTWRQNKSMDPEQIGSIPSENGTIELCFSKIGNCSIRLITILKDAQAIKTALYDLDDKELIAILKSKNADVLVDEDNYFGLGKNISGAGLMHNKFWIIYNSSGRDYLVTGSMNPTYNDISKNDNNLLIIESEYLMRNYEEEFSELKKSSPDKPTRFQKIMFNGNTLENYFCPEDDCEGKVLSVLRSAKHSVYFMTFSFTSDPIGDFLISKKSLLEIRGVFDESQVKSNKEFSEYNKMVAAGMDVRIDGNPAKLHHKVFIIDNSTVVTGSYNPTGAGTGKNDENILILHDKEIANRFVDEFERVWSMAG